MVIFFMILVLKDLVMSKLKNFIDFVIDKYNNLIVCDNGEKKKFLFWMEDFLIWQGKIIIDFYYQLLYFVMVCNCFKG